MGLNVNILGEALYQSRESFNNKTMDELIDEYGTLENVRKAACIADAQVIIEHFQNYAALSVPGTGLTAGANPVTGASITGKIL